MKFIFSIVRRYRTARSISRLNSVCASFGIGPKTEAEWHKCLARLAPAMKDAGISAADLSATLSRVRIPGRA